MDRINNKVFYQTKLLHSWSFTKRILLLAVCVILVTYTYKLRLMALRPISALLGLTGVVPNTRYLPLTLTKSVLVMISISAINYSKNTKNVTLLCSVECLRYSLTEVSIGLYLFGPHLHTQDFLLQLSSPAIHLYPQFIYTKPRHCQLPSHAFWLTSSCSWCFLVTKTTAMM